MNTVIFDIDGTLADSTHREHLFKPETWDAFVACAAEDRPVPQLIRLIEILHARSIQVILMTGRIESERGLTEDWLTCHCVPYHRLIMRPDHDTRHDVEVKRDLFNQNFKDKSWILFVVEDRDSVVAMWREMGLLCLQPKRNEYEYNLEDMRA